MVRNKFAIAFELICPAKGAPEELWASRACTAHRGSLRVKTILTWAAQGSRGVASDGTRDND